MNKSALIPADLIERHIFLIRGHKVMLDFHLAELYGVETKQLKRAVKRNNHRFPDDFMFILSKLEYKDLRSQFGTLKRGKHSKYLPYAFTEQGVSMLSSVLNSERAVKVNIEIMRAFVRMREIITAHKELSQKLSELEKKIETHDEDIRTIFEAIRELMTTPDTPAKQIGFKVEERRTRYLAKIKSN